jgi:hypothetical protein
MSFYESPQPQKLRPLGNVPLGGSVHDLGECFVQFLEEGCQAVTQFGLADSDCGVGFERGMQKRKDPGCQIGAQQSNRR